MVQILNLTMILTKRCAAKKIADSRIFETRCISTVHLDRVYENFFLPFFLKSLLEVVIPKSYNDAHRSTLLSPLNKRGAFPK